MRDSFRNILKLKENIDDFLSGQEVSNLFKIYNKTLGVPEEVSQQYMKQRLSRLYVMTKASFSYKISIFFLPISLIQYLGYLIYVWFCSSKSNELVNRYALLVDEIPNGNELQRWSRLEEKFTVQKTLFISRVKLNSDVLSKHNIITRSTLHKYNRKLVSFFLFKRIVRDIVSIGIISVKKRVNFFHLHIIYVNDYLYYKSIFIDYKGEYLIQDRNLGRTNALKNYLFKNSGGKFSCCTQKNLIQHNSNNLFYDTDIFFSLGSRSCEDVGKLGSRIGMIIPVGSLSMEEINNRHEGNFLLEPDSIKYDVLLIGINMVNATSENNEGYYKSISWLAELSNYFGELNFYIKHHPSWDSDPRELEIIEGGKIKYVDKQINSYEVCRDSKIILTYGSTMAYELLGFGKKVYMLDPDKGSEFLSSRDALSTFYVSQLDDLKAKINKDLKSQEAVLFCEDYCLPNVNVSEIIHDQLTSLSLR